jgi:exonuclease III
VKILAWNIQQGGAKRADSIIELIERHAPDVLVLTELRPTSADLLAGLSARGWTFQVTGVNDNPTASAGIVSRHPIVPLEASEPSAVLPGRFLEAWIPGADLVVAGLYGPLRNEKYNHFWEAVRRIVPARAAGSYLLAGDLNTGESLLDAPDERFFCSDHFCALRAAGLVDVWRVRNPQAREWSYFHRSGGGVRGAGFRLDHLLASRALANRVQDCRYDHTALDMRTSDHAPLFVQLA